MSAPTLKYSTGFNLPFNGDNLLNQFGAIRLKNGATEIDAVKSDFVGGGGGATSLGIGSFKFFNSGTATGTNTTSYKGNGTQYFTTPTADSSQQISVASQGGSGGISIKQTAATNNQTLANKLAGLTTTQYVLLGGAVAGAILLIVLLRK